MTLTKREQEKLRHENLNELLAVLDVDVYLNKNQAAVYLSISVSFLETLMAEDGLPFYRIRKKILFRKHEIDQWSKQFWEQGESQDIRQLADEALRTVLGEEQHSRKGEK